MNNERSLYSADSFVIEKQQQKKGIVVSDMQMLHPCSQGA